MTMEDLRKKYIGRPFIVKATGQVGRCIKIRGFRRDDQIILRWCIWISNGKPAWYMTEQVKPVKDTLF